MIGRYLIQDHREVQGVLSPDSKVQPHLQLHKVSKITVNSLVTELLGPALPVLVLDLTDLRFPSKKELRLSTQCFYHASPCSREKQEA